jgi:small-conductance mechanosensitive channel
MPLSIAEIIYVAVVVLLGSYALARTLSLLVRARRHRLRTIHKRRRFEAVDTDTPVDDPKSVALQRGIDSIEQQFSVFRRLLVPLILFITFVLAAPVFLTESSATTASLVGAVLAVVLGLALRPYLENAIAGMVIGASRLVRIGDTVLIDDWFGTIEDITDTHTTIKLWDWRRYLIPNSRMLETAFLNYSLFDTFQWAYIEFWVAPDADLDTVKEIAIDAARESEYFADCETPEFWVMRMEKDAIGCWLAAWAETPAKAWALKNDVRTKVLSEFRHRGIAFSLQRHRWSTEEPDRHGLAKSFPT